MAALARALYLGNRPLWDGTCDLNSKHYAVFFKMQRAAGPR